MVLAGPVLSTNQCFVAMAEAELPLLEIRRLIVV